MTLRDEIPEILSHTKAVQPILAHNKKIFDILEGNLLQYVVESMSKQMKPESLRIAQERIPPINILAKVVRKLSTLYVDQPTRSLGLEASEQDKMLVSFYEKAGVNRYWHLANENYNAAKTGMIEIFEDVANRRVGFRTLPPHTYVAYAGDNTNPTKLTAVVKIMGRYRDKNGEHVRYHVYTDTEFASVNEEGDYILEDMRENDGQNPFGVIPFQYINRSQYSIVPQIDSDTIRMATLFCTILADINFASMFLGTPILYTLDVNAENLTVAPNTFWNLKSDDTSGKAPQIGVLKPEPDLEAQLMLAVNELKLWLESRDIRPGSSNASLTIENAASGISLVVQEMDTTKNRKSQEVVFAEAERDFWKRLAKIHNFLALEGRIDERSLFVSPEVSIRYSEHKPIEDRMQLVQRLKLEHEAGFLPKREAIRQLYPHLSEEEIERWISASEEVFEWQQSGSTSSSKSIDDTDQTSAGRSG